MNPNFKQMTLQELFQGLFTSVAYKNFIPKYRSLLLEPIAGQKKETRSAHELDAIAAAAQEVAQLMPRAFGIYKLIAEKQGDKTKRPDFITAQTALHEYLIKTLYLINRNCHTLLEAQVDYEMFASVEGHLKTLKTKYILLDEHLFLIGQEWRETDETIYYSLVEGENKVKVFETDANGVAFQVYNSQMDEQIKVPRKIRMDNGLIISLRYFFFAILRIFQHLQWNTQLCELEKRGVATLDSIEEVELGTEVLNAFNQAAREIL